MRRVVRTLDLEHNPDFFKGTRAKTINLADTAANGWARQQVARRRSETSGSVATDNHRRAGTAREDLDEAKRLAPYVNTILAGSKSSRSKRRAVITKRHV